MFRFCLVVLKVAGLTSWCTENKGSWYLLSQLNMIDCFFSNTLNWKKCLKITLNFCTSHHPVPRNATSQVKLSFFFYFTCEVSLALLTYLRKKNLSLKLFLTKIPKFDWLPHNYDWFHIYYLAESFNDIIWHSCQLQHNLFHCSEG